MDKSTYVQLKIHCTILNSDGNEVVFPELIRKRILEKLDISLKVSVELYNSWTTEHTVDQFNSLDEWDLNALLIINGQAHGLDQDCPISCIKVIDDTEIKFAEDGKEYTLRIDKGTKARTEIYCYTTINLYRVKNRIEFVDNI